MAHDLATKAQWISLVAWEAAEESDAIARHPEVIDVLTDLSQDEGLDELFGGNGHDPAAFIGALVDGLRPYREEPGEIPAELITGLELVAHTLRQSTNGAVPHA